MTDQELKDFNRKMDKIIWPESPRFFLGLKIVFWTFVVCLSILMAFSTLWCILRLASNFHFS